MQFLYFHNKLFLFFYIILFYIFAKTVNNVFIILSIFKFILITIILINITSYFSQKYFI